jgi:hypothetical protein
MKKNVKDLEAMINKRADDVVQEKIVRFRKAIEAALANLVGLKTHDIRCGSIGQLAGSQNVYQAAVAQAASLILKDKDPLTGQQHPWPGILWTQEREAIRDELFAKMDLMQQLLVAKPRDNSNDVPCE